MRKRNVTLKNKEGLNVEYHQNRLVKSSPFKKNSYYFLIYHHSFTLFYTLILPFKFSMISLKEFSFDIFSSTFLME